MKIINLKKKITGDPTFCFFPYEDGFVIDMYKKGVLYIRKINEDGSVKDYKIGRSEENDTCYFTAALGSIFVSHSRSGSHPEGNFAKLAKLGNEYWSQNKTMKTIHTDYIHRIMTNIDGKLLVLHGGYLKVYDETAINAKIPNPLEINLTNERGNIYPNSFEIKLDKNNKVIDMICTSGNTVLITKDCKYWKYTYGMLDSDVACACFGPEPGTYLQWFNDNNGTVIGELFRFKEGVGIQTIRMNRFHAQDVFHHQNKFCLLNRQNNSIIITDENLQATIYDFGIKGLRRACFSEDGMVVHVVANDSILSFDLTN
jgi:hypothetical protein